MLRFCSPLALVLAAFSAQPAAAQDLSKYTPEALESELAALADSRIAVMVPMRIEVTSSNFPKFVRNLNTGGPNERESKGVVATNVIHHAPDRPSYIELPVVR